MKISNKILVGRVTIPKAIREVLSINDGDSLLFDIDEETKIITIEKENRENEWIYQWTSTRTRGKNL